MQVGDSLHRALAGRRPLRDTRQHRDTDSLGTCGGKLIVKDHCSSSKPDQTRINVCEEAPGST